MLRFILDFHTGNIIVIFDSSPSSINYVDFYYVADFLNIGKDENDSYPSVKDVFYELLHYWKSLFTDIQEEIYLIYDLSDQYIAAYHFEQYQINRKKFLRVSRKHTQDFSGCSVNKEITLEELKRKNWVKDEHFSHYLSLEFAMKGMDWSIENLKINTNLIEI
jgi:hypothetical protein